MRMFLVLGALLIVFGVAVLVNQGMSFSTRGKSVNVGSVEITQKQRHHIPMAMGALAAIGGVALVIVGTRKP